VTGAGTLDRAVAQVVQSENCSGCGACTLLDQGLRMQLDENGYARPARVSPSTAEPGARRTFDQVCPGRRVRAAAPLGSHRHPTLGPIISCWEAWAADPEIRERGSSGGTLTALVAWLVESGQLAPARAVAMDPEAPRRSVPVSITSRSEALAAAGSRYAPVAALGPGVLAAGGAVVAKPCEISAARALVGTQKADAPLLLSFFCAGTPSQAATDSLLAQLGVSPETPLDELWYRGRGWPGAFTARTTSGKTVQATYDESWGQHLGRTTQWRCKICPDGVGESADVSAADFWHTDARGYPVFTEGAGWSALLARTARGHDLLTRAFEAGVLVGRPLNPDALAQVQPLQVGRRVTLLGRLLGARAASRPVPRYQGFGLLRLAVPRWRETARTAVASFRRVRRGPAVRVAAATRRAP
jgi:coenzyme F420 hydrogenase subunit beta